MIIDVYNHFMPKPFLDRLADLIPGHVVLKAFPRLRTLWDVEARLKLLDRFGDYAQILSLANPPIELLAGPEQTPELARIANDGLAELCRAHPDRFPAFIASMPMNNVAACLQEIERAVGTLGARGIQVFTNVAGTPLSAPQFRPIFARMAQLDLPIWIHPIRGPQFADYTSESQSEAEIWFTFGWPYETTAAVTRLIYSGIYDELPGLKIITHHMGGIVPMLEGRIGPGNDQLGARTSDEDLSLVLKRLKKRPLDYFKHSFYADTATFSAEPAMHTGLAFFDHDKVVFASDCPFDPEKGTMYTRDTLRILEGIDMPKADKDKIWYGNLERITGTKLVK